MKKIILALLSVFLLVNNSKAEVVTIFDYDTVPPLGSWMTYGYIYPDGIDDFTVRTTKVESGQFAGKLRRGDYYEYHPSDSETRWIIYEALDQSLTLYEDSGVVYNPPLVFDENFKYQTELDCFLNCNVYPFSNFQPMPEAYWTKVSGVTVLAGTFDDVIVKFSTPPDDRYPPNSANSLYNLNPTEVPYAVTHIKWYAKGVGLIKCVDINSATGDVIHQYELESYNFTQTVILTAADPNVTIPRGFSATVYGTSGINEITVESGAYVKLINFPGSNLIEFQSEAAVFEVSRSGAVVTFRGSDGTTLKIPATSHEQTIIFNIDDVNRLFRILRIENNQVMLNGQAIGTEAAAIAE